MPQPQRNRVKAAEAALAVAEAKRDGYRSMLQAVAADLEHGANPSAVVGNIRALLEELA